MGEEKREMRLPDAYWIYGENGKRVWESDKAGNRSDVLMDLHMEQGCLVPAVTAGELPLCYAVLKWFFHGGEHRAEPVRILGDAWERAYGDLSW